MLKQIGDGLDLDALRRRAEAAKATFEANRAADITTNTLDLSNPSECEYGCMDGFILTPDNTARPCLCQQQRRLNARMTNAMIPEEFEDAEFRKYRIDTATQTGMLEKITDYLNRFKQIQHEKQNSFGFMAAFGEARLRELRGSARVEAKAKHNNFGLGKTHLQIAAAKELIRQGYTVLCVSDVAYMEDLSKARAFNDESEALNRLLGAAIQANVLIWDDIGKAKPSEFRLDMYYQIINERYKAKRPIIFSSNEDSETLTERIGDAAASRLLGMARGNTYAVEGKDDRLTGGRA